MPLIRGRVEGTSRVRAPTWTARRACSVSWRRAVERAKFPYARPPSLPGSHTVEPPDNTHSTSAAHTETACASPHCRHPPAPHPRATHCAEDMPDSASVSTVILLAAASALLLAAMLYPSTLVRWLQRKRYQYEVTFSLYMLTPTEKFILSTPPAPSRPRPPQSSC